MSELRPIHARRVDRNFIQDKARVVISFTSATFMVGVFAADLVHALVFRCGLSTVPFPGIIGQTLLFTSMFMGIGVIRIKFSS